MDKLKVIDECLAVVRSGDDSDLQDIFDLSSFISRLASDLDTDSPIYGRLHVKRKTIYSRLRYLRKQIESNCITESSK